MTPNRLRHVAIFSTGLATLAVVLACQGGLSAYWVDEGLGAGTDDARPIGEACRSSSECAEGLRCLRRGVASYCVQPCEAQTTCPDGQSCHDTLDPSAGFCPPPEVVDDGPALPGPTTPGDPPIAGPADDGSCGDTVEVEVVALFNEARAERGLPALTCDGEVARVAREHSRDMAERGYFDHVNPDGEEPWDRLDRGGVPHWASGENIAAGATTANEVHVMWMNSDGHRANILGDWTAAGVGRFRGNGRIYWTAVFITN